MPVSSPVYQTTTVTYQLASEPEPAVDIPQTRNVKESPQPLRTASEWIRSKHVSLPLLDQYFQRGRRHNSTPFPYFSIRLCLGFSFLAVGLICFVCGFIDYDDTIRHHELDKSPERSYDLTAIFIGLLFVVLAVIILGLYVRNLQRVKICSSSIKEPLTSSNDQIITINQPNDFIESVKYKPDVSNFDNHSEISKLMSHDVKESDAKEVEPAFNIDLNPIK